MSTAGWTSALTRKPRDGMRWKDICPQKEPRRVLELPGDQQADRDSDGKRQRLPLLVLVPPGPETCHPPGPSPTFTRGSPPQQSHALKLSVNKRQHSPNRVTQLGNLTLTPFLAGCRLPSKAMGRWRPGPRGGDRHPADTVHPMFASPSPREPPSPPPGAPNLSPSPSAGGGSRPPR